MTAEEAEEQRRRAEAAEADAVIRSYQRFCASLAASPRVQEVQQAEFRALVAAYLLADLAGSELVDGRAAAQAVPLDFNSVVSRLIMHVGALPTNAGARGGAAGAIAAAAGGGDGRPKDDDASAFLLADAPSGGGSGGGGGGSGGDGRRRQQALLQALSSGAGTSSGLRGHRAAAALSEATSKRALVTSLRLLRSLLASLPLRKAEAQCKLCGLGAVGMALDKLGEVGKDDECFRELLETLIALLDGGNAVVQRVVRAHLSVRGQDAFFDQVSARLRGCAAQLGAEAQGAPPAPKALAMRVFRLLQLLCEGHNAALQNFLRERGGGVGGVDLVAESVEFFGALHAGIRSRDEAELAVQVLDTLVEFVQGPCYANQMRLVQNKFVEAAGALLGVAAWPAAVPAALQKQLRFKTVLALVSLFEGRHEFSVHRRVAGLLPLDVARETMRQSYAAFMADHGGQYGEGAFLQRFTTKQANVIDLASLVGGGERRCAGVDIGFAVFILLRQLVEAKALPEAAVRPARRKRVAGDNDLVLSQLKVARGLLERESRAPATYADAYYFFEEHCARVEIVRYGELEFFLFPIPPVCAFLTQETRARTEWDLNRDSPNEKISDFFSRFEGFIMEMMHQQWVNRLVSSVPLVSAVIMRVRLWKRLSWLLALLINVLILGCYEVPEGATEGTCEERVFGLDIGFDANRIITVLGIMQTLSSSCIVVYFLLNYAPLIVKAKWRERERLAAADNPSDGDGDGAEFAGGGSDGGGGGRVGASDGGRGGKPPAELGESDDGGTLGSRRSAIAKRGASLLRFAGPSRRSGNAVEAGTAQDAPFGVGQAGGASEGKTMSGGKPTGGGDGRPGRRGASATDPSAHTSLLGGVASSVYGASSALASVAVVTATAGNASSSAADEGAGSLFGGLEGEMADEEDDEEDDGAVADAEMYAPTIVPYEEARDRMLATAPFGIVGGKAPDPRFGVMAASLSAANVDRAVSADGRPGMPPPSGTDSRLLRAYSMSAVPAASRGESEQRRKSLELENDEDAAVAGGGGGGGGGRQERSFAERPLWWIWRHVMGLMFLLRSPTFLYWLLYILMTVLGNAVHPYFFAFHLVDIINQYEELRIVLRSVTTPIKQLSLTFILFVITEYFFAVLGFAYIRSDYSGFSGSENSTECNSLLQCLITTFDQGFKSDGGIGGYMEQVSLNTDRPQHFFGRLLYDNLFNILLITVLLNVTFGIIIDTFGALRQQTKEKEEDMNNVCFICGIDRSTFDRHTPRGFEDHRKNDHDKWNYVYMAAHLQFKPRTERTGVEEYLWRTMHRGDLGFFPMHRASVLRDAQTPEDDAEKLQAEVGSLRRDMQAMQRHLRAQTALLRRMVAGGQAAAEVRPMAGGAP